MLRIRIKKLEEGRAEAKAEPRPVAAPCSPAQQRPAVVQLPPTQVCTHNNQQSCQDASDRKGEDIERSLEL
jgi:hypothetical protein